MHAGHGFSPLLASVVLAWFFFGRAAGAIAPISTAAPDHLKSYSHSIPIPSLLATPTAAIPSGKFWTPFVLNDGRDIIAPLPYIVRSSGEGLEVGYPEIAFTAEQVSASTTMDFTVGAGEPLQEGHRVTTHDELSVWLRFSAVASNSVDGSASLTAPLVRGSPYITVLYTGLTPEFTTNYSISDVNGLAVGASASATRLIITLSNGRVWTLYVPNGASVLFESEHTLRFMSPYSGPIRLAVIPTADAQQILDAHSLTLPTAAAVDYEFVDATTALLMYSFTAEGNGGADLLMLALPHHVDVLNETLVSLGESPFRSVLGPMSFVIGSQWEMSVALPELSWMPSASTLSTTDVTALRASLYADSANLAADAEDPYHFGLQISRIARLALIADELQETSIAATCRDVIVTKLSKFLTNPTNDSHNPLGYETQWGGVVASSSLWGEDVDGGNGWFKDHHIQYGPMLYAAAVALKEPNAFGAESDVKQTLFLLARDIANPSSEDVYFPKTRHKDWYQWNSYSDGLSYNATTGHSLSSISESADAYYSLALFAAMYGQSDLASFGRLLSAMELVAAKKYWLTSKVIYAPEFAANKLASHVSAVSVTASPLVHSLARHMRPLSPTTAQLFSSDVVQDMMTELSASVTESLLPSASAYRSFFHLVSAMLNPTTAFESIAALPLLDSTQTRTEALYWCATRFASSVDVHTPATAKPMSFYLRVHFSNDASTAAQEDPNANIDTGAAYSKSRGYGWTGTAPALAVHQLAASYSSNFATVAIVPARGEWRVDLPAAGDYIVRLALAPATEGLSVCPPLVLTGEALPVPIGTCAAPLSFSSTTVSLTAPVLRLSSPSALTAIAMVEIFPATGIYLNMTFNATSLRITPAFLAAVMGIASERFYVASQTETSATALVIDPDVSASSDSAATVATAVQHAPSPLWAHYGLYVRSIEQRASPTPTPTPKSGGKSLSHAAIAFIVLGAITAVMLVAFIAYYIWLRRQRADSSTNVELASRPAPTESMQDLLRAASSTSVASDANLAAEPASVSKL